MAYTTIYDVSEAGYRMWWAPAMGIAFVAVSIVGLRYKSPIIRYPLFGLIFSALWTAYAFVGTYTDYYRLSSALHESRCEVVEGPLTQLQIALPATVHINESFVVNGRRFACSNTGGTAGYIPTRPDGAPLREFLPIRIHHLRGEIARLEIASPDS